MNGEEYLSLLYYVSGILGSEHYNGNSLVQEERDEERLTTYIHELSSIYRNNIEDKSSIRLKVEKVFGQIRNNIVPSIGNFRKPENLFRTLAALAHIVALPQQAIDVVKAKPIDLKKLTSLSDFLSIVKGTSIKDNLNHYQTYLSKLSRMENVAEYSGLQSFLTAVNLATDVNLIAKEMISLVKVLEKSSSRLQFASLLQLAQISAKVNNGKISETLLKDLDAKAIDEATFFDRNDFYQYFSLARFTGTVSPAVIKNFIEIKSKNKEIELKPDWVKELISIYKQLPKGSESIDILVSEFEADLAHLAFQLQHPLHITEGLNRLYN